MTDGAGSEGAASIHYLGHASFLLHFDNGITILTDYGKPNAWVHEGWDSPIHSIGNLTPDVVTYSHTHHEDHYDPTRLLRPPRHILTKPTSLGVQGVAIEPIRTCEASPDMADNTSYAFTYRGLRLLHLGDCQANITQIGDPVNRERLAALFPEPFDLVLMPIEGKARYFHEAASFLDMLHPRRVIPMHYWSEACREEFLRLLVERSQDGRTPYIIEQDGTSEYRLRAHDHTTQAVTLVVLTPSPYHAGPEVHP
jgi:L-ascorbate metabolism protein UlaG (beta-lactamase superfamily)